MKVMGSYQPSTQAKEGLCWFRLSLSFCVSLKSRFSNLENATHFVEEDSVPLSKFRQV